MVLNGTVLGQRSTNYKPTLITEIMRVISNAQKFLDLNPMELDSFKNLVGQRVRFLEHPTRGDGAPVYGEINGVVFDTEFFDTEDMSYNDSDYSPLMLADGSVVCSYEIRDYDICKAIVAHSDNQVTKAAAQRLLDGNAQSGEGSFIQACYKGYFAEAFRLADSGNKAALLTLFRI
jgi:hypothetical protein